jgi:uncharacterized protein (DUF1800 family)
MLAQQEAFRRYGHGDFALFVKAMLRDPALVFWLDGQTNSRQAPNENLARELMELFTLGIGNYTEQDVREGARALTGWVFKGRPRADATAELVLNPNRHDAGQKTILGHTGAFDADAFADILMQQPANAEFLAERLWFRFASGETVPAQTKERLASAYRPARDIKALVEALFTDPEFPNTVGQLVKQPVEWAVGAMRQLRVLPANLPDQQQRLLLQALDLLGQVPFQPPSVGGWPAGAAWLTTSATQVRVRAGEFLAAHADASVIAALTAVPAGQRVDALARLLVVDAFTDRTKAMLTPAAAEPRRLIALGLASPEYSVS